MKIFLTCLALALGGCAIPKNDPSFVAEKSPAVAALAGEVPKEGKLGDRIKAANEKNNQRLLDGDWRAVQPVVGPRP
ncbi:MAG: hypothetical protein WCP67_02490 [Verrucomicrobiota bacterium]|jgi:hypothetical protein